MSIDDSLRDLFPEFAAEACDILAKVKTALKSFPSSDSKKELVEEVFRGIHTMKGNCAGFGLEPLGKIAHDLETRFGGCRADPSLLKAENIAAILTGIDLIEEGINLEAAATGTAGKPGAPSSPSATPAGAQRLASVRPPSRRPPPASKSPKPRNKTIAPRSGTAEALPDVLRVPLSLVTSALNNIWEVFLIRNQIAYLLEQERPHLKHRIEFLQTWELLDSALKRNISELESTVMVMRMSPIKGLYARMEKLVRSYAGAHPEKEVILKTEGEAIELDKKVIDALGEPLVHLVRNALDHGVETAEQRRAAGKPPRATVTLSACAVADRVLVKVQDDGRGIDGPALLAKARAKGFHVSEFEKSGLSPVRIVFLPGFTTAETVTDVSGRGVGMDVVRHSIEELGGSIEIDTVVGHGSTFSIYLPLSLSVIPATVFEVNGELYGANTNSIVEICRVPESEIRTSNGASLFFFRDKFIRCIDARRHLSTSGGLSKEQKDTASLFVLDARGELVAIRISWAMANTEVVVKPVPPLLPRNDFVQGMSILPTGKAIFILSLDKLVEPNRQRTGRPKEPSHEAA